MLISIHVASLFDYAISQQIFAVSSYARAVTYSITPCSENLSSVAEACGPTFLHDTKLQATKTRD